MVEAILGIIGSILYPLFSILFLFLDILQDLFYSFAGIGTVYYGSGGAHTGVGSGSTITGDAPTGTENDTGLLYYLFNSPIVKNILISMMILALFLIIIFTTLAFIKTIYAEKPKSWKDILSSAVKGLVNFIVLPVCCLLGVWVGNIILQAVNGATSTGGATRLSRKLFICVSYNANKYRGKKAKDDGGALINETLESNSWLKDEIGIQSVESGQSNEYYAEIVDQMFASMSKKGENLGITWQWDPVSKFYRLYDINYIMLIIGGVFMMYVMINVTYGMIKRLFILLMLFVISPALCALYPLDDGNAVKSWTGDVRKNILSAYGAVAGMNLLFSFLPIVQNIKITFGWAADTFFINNLVQLILMVCALFCMNDFISMITGYIGAGNAFADGKSLRGSTQGAFKKYGKATVDKGIKVGGAFVRSNQARKDARESGASRTASFFTGVGHLGKEGTAGFLNSAHKAAGDALGLKTKELNADDLFKKGSVKKVFESTGLGVSIGDYKKGQKDAAYQAEQKKLKKGYEEDFKKTGKTGLVGADGKLSEGTESLDSQGTMTKFDSGLLTELDKAENAGLSQEEFVKLVHEQTGVGEDDIRERIKADKKRKAKADENAAEIERYGMERKYGSNKETTATGLTDDTIDKLKEMLVPLLNGQANTGTGAQLPVQNATQPANESGATQLDEKSLKELQDIVGSISTAVNNLESTINDSNKATSTMASNQENLRDTIVQLDKAIQTLASAQTSSNNKDDMIELLRMIREIKDKLGE